MKFSKEQLRASRESRSYNAYVKQYMMRQNQLAQEGYEMITPLKSKNEFKTMYEAIKNTMIEEVELGERKSVSHVIENMVNRQSYGASFKQAKILSKASQELLGEKIKIRDIRIDPSRISDILKEEYRKLKKQGLSSKEAGKVISRNYFGSI